MGASMTTRQAVRMVLVLLLLVATRPAAAAPMFTLGGQLSTPELAGLFASVWPTPELSIDGRVTLASVDAGLSGHIPLAGSIDGWRHDLVVTGLAGWVGIPAWAQPRNGWRLSALAGYGLLGTIDVRLEAGVQAMPGYGGAAFTALAMVGKTF